MKTAMPIFVSCLALAAATQARAEVHQGAVSVSYADLDLSRAEGRAMLEHRVGLAVRKVCPTPAGPQPLVVADRLRDCQAQARSSAADQLIAVYARQAAIAGPPIRAAAR